MVPAVEVLQHLRVLPRLAPQLTVAVQQPNLRRFVTNLLARPRSLQNRAEQEHPDRDVTGSLRIKKTGWKTSDLHTLFQMKVNIEHCAKEIGA